MVCSKFLLPNWHFLCYKTTFHKYFWCSQFSKFSQYHFPRTIQYNTKIRASKTCNTWCQLPYMYAVRKWMIQDWLMIQMMIKLSFCWIIWCKLATVKRFGASESLYSGQFTLTTQLIKPSYFVILPPTHHHSFFRNLPLYKFLLVGTQ